MTGSVKEKPRRLGRGLSSLIGPNAVAVGAPGSAPAANGQGGQAIASKPDNSGGGPGPGSGAQAGEPGLRRLAPHLIDPSPFQPRQSFDAEQLRHLADSIARSGMMQPIVVRPSAGGRFELVAGERRLRAAKLAQLEELPAIVREIDDEGAAELALVENLQREDLNPVERARALRAMGDRFNLTHAQIAERIGLERSSVTNLVRLLELEDELLEMISHGLLSQGHGKALLGAAPGASRVKLAARAAREEWSVRRLEQECRDSGGAKTQKAAPARGGPDRPASLADLERQLGEHLGTKVRIAANSKGDRGRLTVEFYSLDHFDGLMEKMGFRMRG